MPVRPGMPLLFVFKTYRLPLVALSVPPARVGFIAPTQQDECTFAQETKTKIKREKIRERGFQEHKIGRRQVMRQFSLLDPITHEIDVTYCIRMPMMSAKPSLVSFIGITAPTSIVRTLRLSCLHRRIRLPGERSLASRPARGDLNGLVFT